MNKRRERLSPVIDAERRKSGVLERRAHGLEAENAQLGRDLVKARDEAIASGTTEKSLRVRVRKLEAENRALEAALGEYQAEAERWKRNAETAWAWNCELRDMPLWRIAAQRIAAWFKESK